MKSQYIFPPVILASLLGGHEIVTTHAADMAVKAPPLIVPAWTGFYLGPNVGVGTGRQRFFDIFGPVPDFALDADSTATGGVGGFQLGYNYQLNWLVLGVQGDFDWSGIKKSFSCFSFGNQVCSADAEWVATFTGRAGAVVGPALVYIDGGPAWTRDTISNIAGTSACVPVGGGSTVCSAANDLFLGSRIQAGWTIGAGVEYRLSPTWSVNLQYNYMNFGEHPITLVDGGTGIFPEDVKQDLQLIKLGVNYKLSNPTNWQATSSSFSLPAFFGADASDDTGRTIRSFSVLDVGKESIDGVLGALFAFSKDLNTSGPRLWITGGAGWYQFPDSSGNKIRGVYSTGDLLGGYAFEGDNYEINLLAGVSAENDMLSAYDATDPVQGTAFGVKVRGDVYFNPTPMSLIAGEGEYSTAFNTYYTSAKYGYDIFSKGFFVGPEAVYFGDDRYNQWRTGIHFTGLELGRATFDVSGGYARDSVVGAGAYGHLEMSVSF